MMNIQNLLSKESFGVKFKDSICAELCFKRWFESEKYFCNITESRWSEKWLSRNKVLSDHFLKSAGKSYCPEVHCGILVSCFYIKLLSISFPIRGLVNLGIINMKYTCMESDPLSYYPKQIIIIKTVLHRTICMTRFE